MPGQYSKYSDEELVELAKSGKPYIDLAFTEIYNRYGTRVYTFCLFMLRNRDEAQDVYQDTFIRFYKNLDANISAKNLMGYIVTIARNLCYNKIRDRKENIPVSDFDLVTDERGNLERNEMFRLVMHAVDKLEDKYKEPFVLRELDGLAFSEIAELFSITEVNARARVRRAKEKILELMHPYTKEYDKINK